MNMTAEQKRRILDSVSRSSLKQGTVLRPPDVAEMTDRAIFDAGIDHEAADYRRTAVQAVVMRGIVERGWAYEWDAGGPRLTDLDQDALIERYAEALTAANFDRVARALNEMYERGDEETEARLAEYHARLNDVINRTEDDRRLRSRWARPNL